MYSLDTHCGLGTAQTTAIADINNTSSIISCKKNDIVVLLWLFANSNYSQLVCQPKYMAVNQLSINTMFGKWIVNIILGILITLLILAAIQMGYNFVNQIYL